MKDTIRKQRLFIFSLIGVVVISFALLSTYAYQTLKVDIDKGSDDNLTINSGVLDVNFTVNRRINLDNMPLLSSYKTASYSEFIIDNTNSTEDVIYKLKLIDLDYSSSLISNDFKYTLVSVENNKENIISEGSFANLSSNEFEINTKYDNYIFIKSGEKQTVRLYLWLQETVSDQNYLENSYFKGILQVESIFSRDSVDKIIMDFKVYGKTEVSDTNLKSLGMYVDDSNDTNNGKYKIDLLVNGNNLFNTEDYFIKDDSNFVYQNIYLKTGTYIIKYLSNDFNSYKVAYEDGSILYDERNISSDFEITTNGVYRIYIGGNNYIFSVDDKPSTYQAILYNTNNSVDLYEPSKEEKIYSVYLNKPLSCLNDECDYIDFINGVVIRKNNYLALTGKENWTTNEDNVFVLKDILEPNVNLVNKSISSHLKYSNILDNGFYNFNNKSLNIKYSSNDINMFKSNLLKENIKIIYTLENEEKELIPILNLSEFKNMNVVVTDGEISSDKVDITYNK